MNNKTRTMLLTITAAVAALPLAGYALAQSAPARAAQTSLTQSLAQTQTKNDTETNDSQDPAIQGSIALPAEQNGAEKGTKVADTQEAAQDQGMAKITPAQAQAAALAVVKGTATSVQLGNENGFLVYDVTIGTQEVIVDAGNGKVLYQGAVDAGESGTENDNEAGETGND